MYTAECEACPPGTTPNAEQTECVDITDECSTGTHSCPTYSYCSDGFSPKGSYTCACEAGYESDGRGSRGDIDIATGCQPWPRNGLAATHGGGSPIGCAPPALAPFLQNHTLGQWAWRYANDTAWQRAYASAVANDSYIGCSFPMPGPTNDIANLYTYGPASL